MPVHQKQQWLNHTCQTIPRNILPNRKTRQQKTILKERKSKHQKRKVRKNIIQVQLVNTINPIYQSLHNSVECRIIPTLTVLFIYFFFFFFVFLLIFFFFFFLFFFFFFLFFCCCMFITNQIEIRDKSINWKQQDWKTFRHCRWWSKDEPDKCSKTIQKGDKMMYAAHITSCYKSITSCLEESVQSQLEHKMDSDKIDQQCKDILESVNDDLFISNSHNDTSDENDNNNDDDDIDIDIENADAADKDNEATEESEDFDIKLQDVAAKPIQQRRKLQSEIGYLMMKVANLSSTQLDIFADLKNPRARYLNYYSFEYNGSTEDKSLAAKLLAVLNSAAFGALIRGLFRVAWNDLQMQQNVKVEERTEFPIKTTQQLDTALYILQQQICNTKHFLFYELTFEDLQYFYKSPLQGMEKDPQFRNNKEQLVAVAGQQCIDDLNRKSDPTRMILMKANVFSRIHWCKLARAVAPQRLQQLQNGTTTTIQQCILDITRLILNESCLNNYNELPDQPSKQVLTILRKQFLDYLKEVMQSNNKSNMEQKTWQINKCGIPVAFGFLSWMLAFNHFPNRPLKNNNFYNSAASLLSLPTKDRFLVYCASTTTMLNEWLRCACDCQYAQSQQKKTKRFVFPLKFSQLLNTQSRSNSIWSTLLKLLWSLTDWTFLGFYNYQMNLVGLGSQLSAIRKCKGNWCHPEFWDKSKFGSIVRCINNYHILLLPITHAMSIYDNSLIFLRLKKIIDPQIKYVCIVTSVIMPGYDMLFYDKNAFNIGETECSVLSKVFKKFGIPYLSGNHKNETHYSYIFRNSRKFGGKFLCLIEIGNPIRNNSDINDAIQQNHPNKLNQGL